MAEIVSLPRYLLDEVFPGNPRAVAAFEALVEALAQATIDSTASATAAGDLQAASFVTLSGNPSLSNERVLSQGDGIAITTGDSAVTISADASIPRKSGVGRLVFTINGSSNVSVPNGGTLVTQEAPKLTGLADYADDTAAAAGGIGVGSLYRTGSAVKVRVS